MSSNPAVEPPSSYVRQWGAGRKELKFWHSFEFEDGTRIEGVNHVAGLRKRINQFPIPADLTGKRVLDIGAWDGWFAFEMERRGASVLAVDNWDNPLFHQVHARLKSRVEYAIFDVYELTPERVGQFDIVLFMGVLYHLKHPLLALERVCALTLDMAVVDSFILRGEHRPGRSIDERPVMEFYETTGFGGQFDNWVAPSLPCLVSFCRTAGFARAEVESVIEHSACVSCYRHWRHSPGAGAALNLVGVFHPVRFGINFDSSKDEYCSAWFEHRADALALDEVFPSVSGFGVRPITVESHPGDAWQANFKLPPGLKPGFHDVTVAITGGKPSNPRQIAVDLPLYTKHLEIRGVRDGATWISDRLDLTRGRVISVWAAGLPANADRTNVVLLCGGVPLEVIYLEDDTHAGARQINALVPESVNSGSSEIRVQLGSVVSEPHFVSLI